VLTNATRVNFWDQRNNTLEHTNETKMRLESSIKQPILHPNYYNKTKKKKYIYINIYTHEYIFTHTYTFTSKNAHKRSELINSLAAAVFKF